MSITLKTYSQVNTISTWIYRREHSLPTELSSMDIENIIDEVKTELGAHNAEMRTEFMKLDLRTRFELGGYEEAVLVLKTDEASIKTKLAEYEHAPFSELSKDIIDEMKAILTDELASKKRKTKDFSKLVSDIVGFDVAMNNHDIIFLKHSLVGTNRDGFKVKKSVEKALSRMMHVHLTKGEYTVK